MGQRLIAQLLCLLTFLSLACDGSTGADNPRNGKIVCLSPAATDLLVQMGLKDRIIGVSPWDADPDLKARLPKVGDYERVDWEKLAELKPQYLIVQGRPERMPAGLKEKCAEQGVTLVNLQIDRLADIPGAVTQLGEALEVRSEAEALVKRLREGFTQWQGSHPTPAMIILSENARSVAGRENYLDDLLSVAGGANVVTQVGYPTLDEELMQTLRPEVVFVLMPGASEATVTQTQTSLKHLDQIPAVRNGRVVVITDGDALLPASGTVRLLKYFRDAMHPQPTTRAGN